MHELYLDSAVHNLKQGGNFPGGPVVKTLPSNAGGGGNKIPHAARCGRNNSKINKQGKEERQKEKKRNFKQV